MPGPPADHGARHDRRAVLRGSLLVGTVGLLGTGAASCAAPATLGDTVTPSSAPRTLLAYFSRPGENYHHGGRRDLDVGNTEVLARMIAGMIICDVHRLEPVEPYSSDYDATVARNVREQDGDERPAIRDALGSVAAYDTVLLGSPVWNVRPPMIMRTFAESHEFAGTAIHPFVTYAVSGLGRTQQDYAAAFAGADLRPGLAVRGEEVADHEADVRAWLRGAGLLT